MIRGEVKRLNEMIDIKIIQGLSYKREAMRHKSLMSQLAQLTARAELQQYEVRSEVKRELELRQTYKSYRPAQLKWYQRHMNFATLASTFLF